MPKFQAKSEPSNFFRQITDQESFTSRGFSGFQSKQDNACEDSHTLTNSEISGITETSTGFNFLRGHQQLERGKQPGSPQSRMMQQSPFNDMQLLQQQHMMYKQFQELQQQRQIQQFGETMQQNSINPFSAFSKQTGGGQLTSPINGTPVHDNSQMFRNWVQRGGSPAGQGIPNRVLFSQEQGQALHSMGLPQLHDMSLYGTPIANARGDLGQYSHLQEVSNDSVNLFAGASGQLQKPLTQPASFNNQFLGNQHTVSAEQVCMSQGAFMSKQGLPGREIHGQSGHGLIAGGFSGNQQEVNTLKEFTGKQEPAGWPAMQQTSKQVAQSQGFVPLDPMEEKILYNMEDNVCDAFGRHFDMGTGGSVNPLENASPSNTFPSTQSGTWSALMQSAVAESSSSDTGLQEEWSGITFQNTEQPNDNLLSNFIDSEKLETGRADSNLQNASFNSKQFSMSNDGNINSGFSGFQQGGVHFSLDRMEGVHQDRSHGSVEYRHPQRKSSADENQQVQSFMRPDKSLTGQMYMQAETQNQRTSQNNVGQPCGTLEGSAALQHGMYPHSGENAQTPNNFSATTDSSILKAHVFTNQYVPANKQTDYKEQSNISFDNEVDESTGKKKMSNIPRVTHNFYGGAHETYEQQQSCFQNDNSSDCYTSKMSTGQGGHFGQFKTLNDVSSSNLDKGCMSDLQRSGKAQVDETLRDDHTSTFHSKNMLELLHKVDQSREDNKVANFGSGDLISTSDGGYRAENPNAHTSQVYTQSPSSQGFGLRLSSPSQRSLNPNAILSPQSSWQTPGNLNSDHVDSESVPKSQTWLSPPVQSFPSSEKSHQETQYDSRFGTPEHTRNSFSNLQGGSAASLTPSSRYTKNQHEMHLISNIPPASQSSQGILFSGANKYRHFSSVPSQEISQRIFTNPLGQQFLGTTPVSQYPVVSGLTQQGEISVGPSSPWRNVLSTQQHSDKKALDVSSNMLSSLSPLEKDNLCTSSARQGSTDQNSEKGECGVMHCGLPSSAIAQSSSYEEEQLAKLGTDASKISSFSPGLEHAGKHISAATDMTTAPSEGFSLLCDPRGLTNNGNPSNPVQTSDTKMFSLTGKALEQLGVRDTSSLQTATFGQDTSPDRNNSRNAASANHTDKSQINLHMVSSWSKQFGSLRNGQMVPMYDARYGSTSSGQLSTANPSQSLNIHPTMEHVDSADTSQHGRVWQHTTSSLAPNENLPAPFVLAADAVSQNVGSHSLAIAQPKKRKIVAIEPLPWHKEVIEDSRGIQTICMAEQEWAQATNRLMEKVPYGVEMNEDAQRLLRSKRRLVLTTHLMQQLFRPAPANLISLDAVSHSGIISYYVSKLALGDACSMANCSKNNLLVSSDDDVEILKDSKITSFQHFSGVVEKLMSRANKLEDEFQRLNKAPSVVDLRVEIQDVEKYALINRFAKFHGRGQDSSGNTRSLPQRYVMMSQNPSKIPEGLQCLSL